MILVNSVCVSPKYTTIKVGTWFCGALVTVCPTNATYRSVKWRSNNVNVATVNESNGYIYAKGVGTATIYATAIDGSNKSDSITVTVSNTVKVNSVELNRHNVALKEKEPFLLSATVCPENATNQTLVWSSSNPDIATVNDGMITAVSKGFATITATAIDGSGKSSSCNLTVTGDILITSIKVNPSTLKMTVGETYYLYETVCPVNATKKCVLWGSGNKNVATVDVLTGKVCAKGVGSARIYALAQDGTEKYGFCDVTVSAAIPVESISVSPSRKTMTVGESLSLTKTICPPDATNKQVTWVSSDPKVASVSVLRGQVKALSGGKTTITATTHDGNHKSSCQITVRYCGGTNYKDVTQHTMVLQKDGYYVCSKCGYKIKSPALQDKDILSTEDYYKVMSCYVSVPYYSTIQSKEGSEYIPPSRILSEIDEIRSQNKYAYKYEYAGANGIYQRQYPVYNRMDGIDCMDCLALNRIIDQSFSVKYHEITNGNILWHNGAIPAIIKTVVCFIAGFYIPKMHKPWFALKTADTVYDGMNYVLSDLAKKAGYPEIGIILDLILLGCSGDENINVTDKVIYLSATNYIHTLQTKLVFSDDGTFKVQYNSVIDNTPTIIV